MKYKDAHALRAALESRLRLQSERTGLPLTRLRKVVAFERFLSRLTSAQPGKWVLKGGVALQLRLGERARTTQDVDLLLQQREADIHDLLVRAALHDLKDGFSFEVSPSAQHKKRFTIHCLLAGRTFETFHVDVGTEDMLVIPPERMMLPSLLDFAGISPLPILVYPVSQQIAEKVHAYTRPYPTSSRVKDWVDLALLATVGEIQADALHKALHTVFRSRGTHPLPREIPPPPPEWWSSSRRLRRESGLTYASIEEMHEAISRFLNPVLQDRAKGWWKPEQWRWEH